MSGNQIQKAEAAQNIWRLKQQGLSNDQIGQELEMTPSQVSSVLSTTMSKASSELDAVTRQELLALEVARLDELQSTAWLQAINGDTRSADLVLKIIDKRSKLLGLDQQQTETQATVQTVVVTGNSDDYIEALRTIAVEGQKEING